MKKMALMLAVGMVLGLGVVMVGGPALAQDHENITTITTANSAFFGFRPTAANLQTFTANTNPVSCGPMDLDGNMTCTSGPYVRNNTMPGAYTSRADTGGNSLGTQVVVSVNPDFGCGDQVATASACDELATSLHDNVNNGAHNTAPGIGGTIVTDHDGLTTTISGVLVGDLHSQVSMVSLDDGMPSGFITFDRTEARATSFNQEINQSVASIGLVFSESDGTGTNTWTASGGGPSNSNIGRTSGGPPGFPSYIPTAGLPITATLSITQSAMGNDAACQSFPCGDEVIGNMVNFPGNGTFPVTGAFFTPGLGIADWAGSTAAVDTDGFPN